MPEGLFKQITLIFNPWASTTWLKSRFFDKVEAGDDEDGDIFCQTTTYMCNEFLDEADLKRFEIMKTDSPRRYEIEGRGNWGISEGLIYDNWEESNFDIATIRNAKKRDGKPYYKELFGLDWGFSNDPTAVVACSVSEKDREIYIWDEIYEYKCSNDELVHHLKIHGLDKCLIMADSSDEKSIYDLRSLGITRIRKCTKGPNSILAGIQRLQDYKIYIHPSCPNTIMEFSNYAWDVDKEGKFINKPATGFDHVQDSLRYATQNIGRNNFSF